MSELTFDEATHTYRVGDEVLPSVTQILRPYSAFARVPQEQLHVAAERGRHVHDACQYYDEGDLDEASLTDELRGYVAAWVMFRNDYAFEPQLIEHRCWHRQYRYAGTLDRWGEITVTSRGKRVRKSCLLDIKSGAPDPTHELQIAAYAHAIDRETQVGMTVYLKDDGKYKVVEHKPGQLAVFLAALAIHRWKEHNGIE
jgi:hypothetical protein